MRPLQRARITMDAAGFRGGKSVPIGQNPRAIPKHPATASPQQPAHGHPEASKQGQIANLQIKKMDLSLSIWKPPLKL